jgi:hypothetical protein
MTMQYGFLVDVASAWKYPALSQMPYHLFSTLPGS